MCACVGWSVGPTPQDVWAGPDANELRLRVGELHNIQTAGLKRIAISQPTVIDVGIVSARQLLVKGLASGVSDLLIWDDQGQRKLLVTVEDPTLDQQLDQLKRLLNASEFNQLSVTREGSRLFVNGTVPSEDAQQRLDSILSAFPSVTNAASLRPGGGAANTLIELNVQVVEINRSRLDRLGIKWSETGTFTETVFPKVGPEKTTIGERLTPPFKFGALTRTALSNTIKALVHTGLARVLAEPRLVTRSGKSASSLVGGQVPILTSSTTGLSSGVVTTSIQFKDFGVSLNITPTVSDDEQLITTEIKAEVSSIDATNAINIGGVLVPGFKVRRTQTEIVTGTDESIFIAGLLQQEDTNDVDAVPGLGAVPVLGQLFKSSEFKSGETELVIAVTPHVRHPVIAASVPETPATSSSAADSTTAETPAAVETAAMNVTPPPQDDLFQYALQVRQQLARAMEQQPPLVNRQGHRQATLRLHLFADGSLGQVIVGQSSGDEQLDADLLGIAEQQAPYPPFPGTLSSADVWVEVPVTVEGAG